MKEYVNSIMYLKWYPKIEVEWEAFDQLDDKQIKKIKRKIKNMDFGNSPREMFVEYLEDIIFQVKEGLL